MLAPKLRTLYKFQLHLTLARDANFHTGEATTQMVEIVLSWRVDDLESTPTCHGYRLNT